MHVFMLYYRCIHFLSPLVNLVDITVYRVGQVIDYQINALDEIRTDPEALNVSAHYTVI